MRPSREGQNGRRGHDAGSGEGLDGLELDVAITGVGVGGLYALYSMREKLGLNVQAFDMASGVGGTWFWNRYPGCRVDTESTAYTSSFDLDMFQNWHWSERYARQSEVLDYMNAVADKHDLKRSINFNTKIERAEWDEAARRWVLTTGNGETVRARYLIEAVGLLSSAYAPQFPDRDKFKGQVLVASKWPEQDPDLTGKRVAVVGTGSTGIQIITAIAGKVGHLHVLQCTPQWVVPLGIGSFPQDVRERIKQDPTGYRDWALNTGTVFGFVESTTSALAVTPEDRQARYEAAWQKGNGFSFMLETFSDITVTRVTLGKEARTIYSATKGALQSMARTWALELGPQNITVNCVAPGPIATTAFWENNPPDSERFQKLRATIPLGRMGTPEDVANAASFFCDARAGFVTGQTMFVCGGVTVG